MNRGTERIEIESYLLLIVNRVFMFRCRISKPSPMGAGLIPLRIFPTKYSWVRGY